MNDMIIIDLTPMEEQRLEVARQHNEMHLRGMAHGEGN